MWLGSVGGSLGDDSTLTLGMAASALALLSNHVVKTTIKPLMTIPITPATMSPKMPAAMAPREALDGSWVGVLRFERGAPWLTAEASSITSRAGRAKANRFAMLLMTSGHSNHCQPPKGPVKAGSEK